MSPQTIQTFIDIIQQYWKLKRTTNYGLPLIKVVSSDTIEEIQTQRRYDILRLRVNLERIRNLSYMIIRREKMKRSWLLAHKETVMKSISVITGVQMPDEEKLEHCENVVKLPLAQVDKIKLGRDIINCDVIYSEEPQSEASSKKIVKDLNRFVKVDQIRRNKPNPYAKYYLQGTKQLSECSDQVFDNEISVCNGIDSILVNGLATPKTKGGPPESTQSTQPTHPVKTKGHPTSENIVQPKAKLSKLSKTRQNRVNNKPTRSPPITPVKEEASAQHTKPLSGYKIPRKVDEEEIEDTHLVVSVNRRPKTPSEWCAMS